MYDIQIYMHDHHLQPKKEKIIISPYCQISDRLHSMLISFFSQIFVNFISTDQSHHDK